MSEPGGGRPGRDSRLWPILLAAAVTAVAVLTYLALVGPPGDAGPSAGDRPSGGTASPPQSSPASPTATNRATPSAAPTSPSSPTPARSPSSTPTPTPKPTQQSAAPVKAAKEAPEPAPLRRLEVVVFNQTTRRHLAAETAEKIEDGGWTVVGVDNWIGTVPRTTVYYPEGYRQDARQLADFLGVDRIRERVSPMRNDRLTLILMTDYLG